MPPLLSSSPPSTSSELRLGTFNVGLGFTRKLPHILTRCHNLALDIVALQEIGDPAMQRTTHMQYIFIASSGPSAHEAGVALLISMELAPRCRAYKRSKSGRLVGVILELRKGHQLLVVSAYMPSGIDHRARGDASVQLAHELYAEMITWTLGVQQVILLGDLNETLTPLDRLPPTALARGAAPSPIQCLQQHSFTDVYRSLHPSSCGFTHAIDGMRTSRSRIDYIWTQRIPHASHRAVHIDTKLHPMSHHHLLWVILDIDGASTSRLERDLQRLRLPNLRATSSTQRATFVDHLEQQVEVQQHHLSTLASTCSTESLSTLAADLTSLVHRSAYATLPITGSKPYRTKTILQLERMRRDLTRILRLAVIVINDGHRLVRCPQWIRLYSHCLRRHHVTWSIDAHYHLDDAAWIHETQRLITRTRSTIAHEKQRLRHRHSTTPFDANPAAAIHRMLQSDALPSQLFSVIDSHGELTNTVQEMEDVMVSHFESVFAIPPVDHTPLVPPPPDMLFDKPHIQHDWYDELMQETTDGELRQLVADTPLLSAPGLDGVSTGVWKFAIEDSSIIREHIVELFSACLLTATFPSTWKTGVILPFIKDAAKDRTMSNIRPITLQSCLGKLFFKLLARRLGAILQRHPILNESQRGFVLGGTTMKCIDELLDAWDWSRNSNRELHTIFYDIKQAYDSVQMPVLLRAMRRLRMPPSFIALIADSLTDLQSCVRTIYGETRCFLVRRSLRQGDPLAPLLFVILLDALHDGLEMNPFTQQRHGCRLEYLSITIELPSLGYADDTNALANTLADLRIQNDWVQYFMRFNILRLNPLKCEIVGRRSDGTSIDAADVARNGITIDNVALEPVAHDAPIRYLGLHVRFDGNCATQQQKSRQMIIMFTRLAEKFHMSISGTVYMLNVFLLPRLELALHYVHGRGTTLWIQQCDHMFINCIRRLSGAAILLSNTVIAMSCHLLLPSWLEVSVKISELFLRVNSTNDRWGGLGRAVMRAELPASIDDATPLPRQNSASRTVRAAQLAVSRLSWRLQLREPNRGRRRHLFEADPLAALPTLAECSSSALINLTVGASHVAHDVWTGWGAAIHRVPETIHIYTDGSYIADPPASSWSVVIADRWFDDNHVTIPSDENLVRLSHVNGACLIGSSIACTTGIYPAELEAIARTLAMFPLSFSLHIHTDSQASITAITSYDESMSERYRMRMSARTILQLIHHLVQRRRVAGGSTVLSHVRAHTTDSDEHSVGNRLADFQANRARQHVDRSFPLGLQPLPLAQCERWLHLTSASTGRVVIDDIRRSARDQLRQQAKSKWLTYPRPQGLFAGEGTADAGRIVLKRGSSEQQATFVLVATNSIQHHWVTHPDRTSRVQELTCDCTSPLSISHLASCAHGACQSYRRRLHTRWLDCLQTNGARPSWVDSNRRHTLDRMLLNLFPPAGSERAIVVSVAEHIARCVVGVFTERAGVTAMMALGMPDRDSAHEVLCQLRLICLDQLDKFYSNLKVPH